MTQKNNLLKRYPLHKKADPRGWLIQNEVKEVADNMQHFLISFSKPGAIRGNHYHTRKRDWFCVIQGKARLYLYDMKTKEKYSTILRGNKPEIVEISSPTVHTIENIGSEQLIFFEIVNEQFNPMDEDTFPFKLR